MRTQVFLALMGLSLLAVSEGKAETMDVNCIFINKYNLKKETVGTLHEKSTDETIKQLQKECQTFPKCTNSSQQPDCVPEVIHPSSSQHKNVKKH